MSINYTYRIISLTLAFLMLFSSIGISKDMHWCQGKVQATSFVGKAKSCSMMDDIPTNCSMKKGDNRRPVISKVPCCHNETEFTQFNTDYSSVSFQELSITDVQFLVAYSFSYILESSSTFTNNELVGYTQYDSPKIPIDIYVLLETFLI